MNRSTVHLLDLPDEILLIILKKLNNIDLLCSLLDSNNGRLNILAQEYIFRNILKFVSIDNLPRIHHNVKCFTYEPNFMERILLATDYSNLTELAIFHFRKDIALNYFTKPSVVFYPYISLYYPPLSLFNLPSTTFSSPILTHLYMNVEKFADCLYLLDGRLRKLTTLCVIVHHMDTFSETVHNMDKLLNLKCFSLKSFYPFQQYDKIILLLRRMSNLEKLTLNLSIQDRNRVIGGTHVQHDILNYMSQLCSFTFYICTYVDLVAVPYKLSSEDIQLTLANIGQQHISSMVNYVTGIVNYAFEVRAACSIFSLPFEFDYLRDIGNNFPNIVFSYVTYLLIEDITPFEHEFFMRIARSFPLLKHLCIWNKKSQELDGLITFSPDNCRLHSIIEYPHLTILDVKWAHKDYIEQFLNGTKTFVPCLTQFEVSYIDDLKAVTKNFTREETRRNCAKVEKITAIQGVIHSKDLCLYFPSLYK
ncbi:unnamed protein product [Adineta steineri]|uniref:F-box domain-containing protein n=1 Tax=Adineta steineri TaxID=433720 RepID=A0A815JVF6_9BILA|nr:unnamed protein product [Adineta steineri]CAF1607802.1 unnamed protein product [Adineta steineri]